MSGSEDSGVDGNGSGLGILVSGYSFHCTILRLSTWLLYFDIQWRL